MIGKYRGNRQAISALVRETEVHRDLYLDQELFELEMEHLFANTWIYVGHESQVPKIGDYFATTIGTQPVIMVRHTADGVKVLTIAARTKARGSPARPAAIPAGFSAALITPGPSASMAALPAFP